jgi:divalent metal cation (Fe/Co/Zn/Cd) transporter
MMAVAVTSRALVARRGRRLEHLTIAWNLFEGCVAVVAGLIAGSVSLVGFGIDSFIEVTSAVAVLWRLHTDADHQLRERHERIALRVVGGCFGALAVYIACEAIRSLILRKAPAHSIPGIILACLSLVIMPALAAAKRKVGMALASGAMCADAKQSDFCFYLSGILLAGLLLNALFGSWWADPAAALVMAPIIGREGIRGIQGKMSCC